MSNYLLQRFRRKSSETDEALDRAAEQQEDNALLSNELLRSDQQSQDYMPQSREHFWAKNIDVTAPELILTKDFIEETKKLDEEMTYYSDAELSRALFRMSNQLNIIFTKEIALSNIPPREKERIRFAFQLARDVLTYEEYAPLEVQIDHFYKFVELGFAPISISRGVGGFTVKEMGTSRGYSENKLSKSSRTSSDDGNPLSGVTGFFGKMFGGGGGL